MTFAVTLMTLSESCYRLDPTPLQRSSLALFRSRQWTYVYHDRRCTTCNIENS